MPLRTPLGAAVSLTTALALTATVPAIAAQAAAPAPTGYTTSTSAELLHVNALSLPGLLGVADVGVARSAGTTDGSAAITSTADATNLDLGLLGSDLGSILARASQSAPPDNAAPTTTNALPGLVPGLLDLGISAASAHARANPGDGCLPATTALSTSSTTTADLALLDVPAAGSLVALPGTVSTTQQSLLPAATATTRAVQASAAGTVADVELLGGQVQVGVSETPTLTATASGTPGGASVNWEAPLVVVTVAGNRFDLPVDGSPLNIVAPDNPLLGLTLRLGQIDDVVESADGTRASASASVLDLSISLAGLTVADLDLLPLEVSATSPVGGVTCGDGGGGSGGGSGGGGGDSDGDGLTDDQENNDTLTDPNNPDTDGDGLTDFQEVNGTLNPYGNAPTNPTVADTDSDGLDDGQEIQIGTDPRDPDTDGDRLTDGEEVKKWKTKPLKADTDGDRLKDGREVLKTRTNPRRRDTDRDGLNDRQEITGSANKRYKKCPTNPRRKDSDRDGLKDKVEIKRHKTNPCDKDTDNGGVSDGAEVRAGSDPTDPDSTPKSVRG